MLHVHLTRWYGHFEGDAMTYRAADEVAKARSEHDCLKLFRDRVTQAALLDASVLDEIDAAVADEIEAAVMKAKDDPLPQAPDLLADVYVRY